MQTILKIAICEDIDGDAETLRALLEGCASVEISRFGTGEAFLSSNPSGKYHIVFMDVYMDGLTGVETARALRESDSRCKIIFTTTSEDHALDGYRVGAARYFVKPIEKESVENALREIMSMLERPPEKVCSVIVNRQRRDIPTREILYAEVRDKHCLIHTSSEVVRVSCSIDELEKLLPGPSFFRSHRAYIVNFEHVQEIGRDFIMKNGDTAYIRKGGAKTCADAYKAWLMDAVWRDDF
jgi:DNA-binding LytR/AlgR family response regulator